MALRYNKVVYWPPEIDEQIEHFIKVRKNFPLSLTDHAIEKLRSSPIYSSRTEPILNYIENVQLDYKKVFEFYYDRGIKKICHREKFDQNYDIILVVSETNSIVTFYFNRSWFAHHNLDKNNYEKGEQNVPVSMFRV